MIRKLSFILVPIAFLSLAALASCAKEAGSDPRANDERLLSNMMAEITSGLEALARELEMAADRLGEEGLSGDAAREALASLCAAHKGALVDCAAIDTEGIMVTVEPEAFRRMEGTDVSRHRVEIELERTKEPVLSQVFKTSEKIAAIAFEWPIFSPEGTHLGSISALIAPDRFIAPLVKKTLKMPAYSGWVAQVDGVLLYSPDPSQSGRNIFSDPYYRGMTEFKALGRKIISEESGRGIFRRHGTGQAGFVERLCIWDTIDLHNARWRVVLVKKI